MVWDQVGGGETQGQGDGVHVFQQALMSMTLSGVPKYGLFFSFYSDLFSLLLSADMYIVVKAGILLDKSKCFFSYVPSLPSLSLIHPFFFFAH